MVPGEPGGSTVRAEQPRPPGRPAVEVVELAGVLVAGAVQVSDLAQQQADVLVGGVEASKGGALEILKARGGGLQAGVWIGQVGAEAAGQLDVAQRAPLV